MVMAVPSLRDRSRRGDSAASRDGFRDQLSADFLPVAVYRVVDHPRSGRMTTCTRSVNSFDDKAVDAVIARTPQRRAQSRTVAKGMTIQTARGPSWPQHFLDQLPAASDAMQSANHHEGEMSRLSSLANLEAGNQPAGDVLITAMDRLLTQRLHGALGDGVLVAELRSLARLRTDRNGSGYGAARYAELGHGQVTE